MLLPTGLFSQTSVTRTTMLGCGSSNRYDTFLSPLDYKGTDVRFLSTVLRSRNMTATDGTSASALPLISDIQLTHDGGFDYTDNPHGNANTFAGHYNFALSLMHRWHFCDDKLTLRAGAMTDLYLGFAYNMRNTANNPAQGYASLGIGAAASASYILPLKLNKRSLSVTYEARLPLAGVMFSPNYGQSYYEIFNRGNYDNNVVFTSFATPSYRHQLTIDVPVSARLAVRVGYLGDIRQAKPNNLRQHTYTNDFIIGITKTIR